MPGQSSDLVDLLNFLQGGGQTGPIDPRAQFLMEGMQGGSIDPNISNLNTALDLLSPGASAAIRDEQQAASTGANLEGGGLSGEDITSFLKQQLGLQESPIAAAEKEFKLKLEEFKQEPAVREAAAKEKEADASKLKAETEAGRLAMEQTQYENALSGEDLTPEQVSMAIDNNLKTIASSGKDMLGNKKSMQEVKAAQNIIMGTQNDPQMNALIGAIVANGEEESIAQVGRMLGVDIKYIKRWYPEKVWNALAPQALQRKGEGFDIQPGVMGGNPLIPGQGEDMQNMFEKYKEAVNQSIPQPE